MEQYREIDLSSDSEKATHLQTSGNSAGADSVETGGEAGMFNTEYLCYNMHLPMWQPTASIKSTQCIYTVALFMQDYFPTLTFNNKEYKSTFTKNWAMTTLGEGC